MSRSGMRRLRQSSSDELCEAMAQGIMFHHFAGGMHPKIQGALSAEELDELLSWVGIGNILPAEEWKARALRGSLRQRDLCITFDDSLRSQYDIAKPVLESHGLTAFWFVYSSVFEGHLANLEVYRYFRSTCFETVDAFYRSFYEAVAETELAERVEEGLRSFDPARYLADYPFFTHSDKRFRFVRDEILGERRYDEIMSRMIAASGVDFGTMSARIWMDDACLSDLAARGHLVGLHSYSHPLALHTLPAAEQRREYVENAAHVARTIGAAPTTMSHPSNSYDSGTLGLLRELGIEIGFRADDALAAYSSLEYPRQDQAILRKAMGRR